MENIMVRQKKYGTLEIDTREKDMIIIFMHEEIHGSVYTEVIHIERENIDLIVKILNNEKR